ncbi:MAG TPA: NEW3 domain-containing protein [Bacteroidales bacterium]|nr:NEW3 domain-containing protein [Bacteroidales bacterium]
MKKIITLFVSFVVISTAFSQQEDQAGIALDLKKARAAYEIAKQKYDNDKELYDQKAISLSEFNNSKNESLAKEVDYQKLILRLISQQSYIIVEKAIKYQNANGEKRVRLTLRSSTEGNQDYLQQFEQHFDVFTPEMRSAKVYNVFASINNISDNTIIGSPYEIRIPFINNGETAIADFNLLRDAESVQVVLNYNGKKDNKNIYLEKDASANRVDITSSQFAQETDLGSSASYSLDLERFSSSDDVYRFIVVNLPRQVSYDLYDAENNARISQLKFNQGVNIRKLSLKAYLPEREDDLIKIDQPLDFYLIILPNSEYNKISDPAKLTLAEAEKLNSGKIKLELIPKGVGRIMVKAPSLYHEIKTGDSLSMKITVMNDGTRVLDNITITTENPLNWKSVIKPDVIGTLAPGKEQDVTITILPPSDVNVGAQEVKIKTQATANNRTVETEDKTIRIQVEARTPIVGTILLILLLIGVLVGIVVFGIKMSRR